MDTTQQTPHSSSGGITIANRRSFGTNLSPNLKTPNPTTASATKRVKLRRTPRKTPPYDLATYEYTVTFLPGPVGVQLEPASKLSSTTTTSTNVSRNPLSFLSSSSSSSSSSHDASDGNGGTTTTTTTSSVGCRVLKLVDGTRPGQARASGKISPGDLIVSINGHDVTQANFHEILDLLKQTETVRQVGFCSVWDPIKLFSPQPPPTSPSPTSSREEEHPHNQTPATAPTATVEGSVGGGRSNTLSANSKPNADVDPPFSETPGQDEVETSADFMSKTISWEDSIARTPVDVVTNNDDDREPPTTTSRQNSPMSTVCPPLFSQRLPVFGIGLIHSPSETVLLSHVLSEFHHEPSVGSLASCPVEANKESTISNQPKESASGSSYERLFKSFFRGHSPVATVSSATSCSKPTDSLLSPSQVKTLASERKKRQEYEQISHSPLAGGSDMVPDSGNDVEDTASPYDEVLDHVVQTKAQLLQELSYANSALHQEHQEKQSIQDMLVSLALKNAQLQQQLLDLTAAAQHERAEYEEHREKASRDSDVQTVHLQQLENAYQNTAAHARTLETELQNERSSSGPFDLKLQVAELQSDLKEAIESRRAAEEELSVAKRTISESESTNRDLQQQLFEQTNMLNSTTLSFQEAMSQNNSLKAELDKRTLTLASKERTLTTMEAQTEKTLQFMEHEMVTLRMSKEQIEYDLQAAEDKAKILQTQLENSKHREGELSAKLEKSTIQFQAIEGGSADLETKLQDSRRRAEELAEDVLKLEKSKELLEHELDSTRVANIELGNRVGYLEREIETRDTKLAANAIDIMSAAANIEQYRRELEHAARKADSLTSEVHALQESNQVLRAQLERAENNMHATKTACAKEIASINEVLMAARQELECQRESAASAASRYEEQLATSKADASRYRDDLVELRRKIAEMPAISYTRNLKEIELQAEAEKKELQDRLFQSMTELEAIRRHADSEIQEWTKKYQGLERDIQAKQDELQSMQCSQDEERTNFESERKRLVNELEKARLEASSVSKSLEESQRESEEISRSKNKLNEEHIEKVKQTTRELAELRHEKELLSQSLARARQDFKEANETIRQLQQTLRTEQSEMAKLVHAKEDEIGALKKQQSKLEAEHARDHKLHRREQQELKSSLHMVEGQRESFRRMLDKAKSDLLGLSNDLSKAVHEKQSLKSDLDRAENTILELRNQVRMLEEEDEVDSSEDSFNNDVAGLTKSELRVKCAVLQEELLEVATRASESSAIAVKRAARIQALEADLQALSNETKQLVQTNDQLEKKLVEMRAEIVATESDVLASKSKGRSLESYVQNLKEKCEHLNKKNAALLRKAQALHNELREAKESSKDREAELEGFRSSLTATKEALDASRLALETERARASQELEDSQSRVAELEQKVADLNASLNETQSSKSMKDMENQKLKNQLLSLEDKCARFEKTVESIKNENNNLGCDFRTLQEHTANLEEEIDKGRRELSALEDARVGDRLELERAAKDLQSHKIIVKDLESKLQELSRLLDDKTDQICALEETIKKMEVDAAEKQEYRRLELVELQRKTVALEDERQNKESELAAARDELWQVTHKLADLEKLNGTLSRRFEEMKSAFQTTKAQLIEVRQGNVHSTNIFKDIENNLEAKQSEVDRLKAQVQILNATVSRLKSDNVLLQESAIQAKSKLAKAEDDCRSNGKAITLDGNLGKSLNDEHFVHGSDQLQQYLEGLIALLDGGLKELVGQADEIEKSFKSVVLNFSLNALDLASIRQPTTPVGRLQSCVDTLASLIAKMVTQLREKYDDLIIRHEVFIESSVSLPSPDGKKSTDHDAALDAFWKMKQLVRNQMMTPAVTPSRGHVHSHYITEAMQVVEQHLDTLVKDLRAAKTALRTKGQLANELERIIRQRETEFKSMEDRLQNYSKQIDDMEDRLKQEVQCRLESEKNVLELREALRGNHTYSLDCATQRKEKAARLIQSFTEKRSRLVVANAFRHWACATSAMKAVSHQVHVAQALSHQLETTREKLVILKSHLKHQKCRRLGGSQGSMSASRVRQSLESLEEGDESFTL